MMRPDGFPATHHLDVLRGIPVEIHPFVPPGFVGLITLGMGRKSTIVARTWGEFYLYLHGVRWHVSMHHCPTWDDAHGCRCMLGEEV